jgi:uncharacterized protein (TIGR03790 family)
MKWLLSGVLVLSSAATALGELKPDEVAIIAMAGSSDSCHLAKYYVRARGIPKSHIYLLKGMPGRKIGRKTWTRTMRPAILNWLKRERLEKKIRCLVTSWDVPLKIGKWDDKSPVLVARKEYLEQARARYVAKADETLRLLDTLAGTGTAPRRPRLTAETSLEDISSQLDKALTVAQRHVRTLRSREEKGKADALVHRLFVVAGGNAAMIQLLSPRRAHERLTRERAAQLMLLSGRLQGLQRGLQSLGTMPGTVARDAQTIELTNAVAGVLGAIRWIDRQSNLVKKNESWSSFDSELSLLYQPDHPVLGWLPNRLHYSYDDVPKPARPILMVSRLAAPTPKRVEEMIDAAVAVERTSLKGKVYLDARGLKNGSEQAETGSFGQYDQSLRDLAARLKKHTKLTVVLDDRKELFPTGSCPDVALYCGWYSLQQYVDAFEWNRGAVGYHMASAEAVWLRNPNPSKTKKAWCPAMLEDGACATLGPAMEPYLVAFPRPDDFFSLLLTGRYCLAEVYYRTKPFNSWVMVLVGDPLYNPYKNHPVLTEEALPEHLRPKAVGQTPRVPVRKPKTEDGLQLPGM